MEGKRLVVDHIGVGVRDYDESVAFYSRALAPLGLELVAETGTDNRAAGFGYMGRDDFWIHEGRPVGRAHIAFEAQSREQVDGFHAAGVEAGGRDNGAPGTSSTARRQARRGIGWPGEAHVPKGAGQFLARFARSSRPSFPPCPRCSHGRSTTTRR
jgi:catechol 2,3-dioxygenase-like lactoylglutathione lyase family enzyme